MNQESKPGLAIDISNANLYDPSTLLFLGYPIRALLDTVKTAGYEGMEWHPFRSTAAGLQMYLGLLNQYEKDGIHSLHQSFRMPRNFKEIRESDKPPFEAVSFVLLPQRTDSLQNLEHVQDVVGKKLPAVLYPKKPTEKDEPTGSFSEKLYQPRPIVMKGWEIKSVEEMQAKGAESGYTGLCIDLFHMRESDKDGAHLIPWQDSLPLMLPNATEVHIAAGRIDMSNSGIDTMQELKDLLNGKGDSDLLKMLQVIQQYMKSSGRKLRFVVEIPAKALALLHQDSGKIYTPAQFTKDHKRIVETIQTFLC